MRKMKRINVFAMVMLIPLISLFTGCYPDKVDYVDEFDMAGTLYDEEADFSSYTTFHVIDTLMHLTEDGEDDPNLSREHDEFVLETVRQNLLNKGYTELASPDSLNMPDLEMLVQVMTSDFYTYYSYWYYYWGFYPGWGYWYPGWGGGYPGYPWNPGYVSSYSTGTLIVEMLDTEASLDLSERPGVIWAGIVNGLLTNNSTNTRARLDKQINQLFVQSPYMKK
jgi:hypothetical protein